MLPLQKATKLLPADAEAHSALGVALQSCWQLGYALESYSRAVEINPSYAEAYNNMGSSKKSLGQHESAITCFRRALGIRPNYTDAHSNLIFSLDISSTRNVEDVQAERKQWAAIHAAPLFQSHAYRNIVDPDRLLRIGYVSADFKMHSAACVFGAMLVSFDQSWFDVVVYSNTLTEDAMTQHFQQKATCWRSIVGLPDDAVADLIRQDEIDILVDLSGHSAGNRLLVFARKPAPIQVTAWGYIGGTGMKVMDVFFADPVTVPEEEKVYYAEEVRYLPSVVSAYFPRPFPEVNALPALKGEGIIFGSFNRLVKISEEAYSVWAQVLLAVPNSRIILKTPELDDAGTRNFVIERFSRAGIDSGQIILFGKTNWQEHMMVFNQVDIALDPFPHGGGVTTLEGLMMGVPVVTLRWPMLVGRLSASILTSLGLTDWIAETPEHYIELAKGKARDLAGLAELREQLRKRFQASIIGDTGAYVREVEGEYRRLWREWCDRKVDA